MKRHYTRTCCSELDMNPSFWGSGQARTIWRALAQTVFKTMGMDESFREKVKEKKYYV